MTATILSFPEGEPVADEINLIAACLEVWPKLEPLTSAELHKCFHGVGMNEAGIRKLQRILRKHSSIQSVKERA